MSACKKPKVVDFRGSVSQAALSKILKKVQEDGLPDAFSEGTQRRQRGRTAFQETPLGALLQTLAIDDLAITVQHPMAMLWAACNASVEFASFFASVLDRDNNIVKIALYSDEISPSSQLDKPDERKTEAVYWSIIGFGPMALAQEEFWFEVCLLRSEREHQIRGGLPRLFKELMRLFCGAPDAQDLRSGVAFTIPGEASPRLLFGDFGLLIQDEVAHKFATDAKGHAGTKLCLACMNVLSHKSARLPCPNGYCVSSASLDQSSFKLHTDASVRAALARLNDVQRDVVRGDVLQSELDLMQQEFGFNANKESFIVDRPLHVKLISIMQFDWMHTYFVNGIFNWEFNQLMKDLNPFGKGHDYFHAYLQRWQWPKGYASGKYVCKKSSVMPGKRDAHASASDFLSVSPVLEKYVNDVCKDCGIDVNIIECMLALFVVVALLQRAASGSVGVDELNAAILRHLVLHQACRQLEMWKPKMHYALHLARSMQLQGILLSCFVLERKHRAVKRWMLLHQNRTNFERSVMEECTVSHLAAMAAPLLAISLKDPREAPAAIVATIRQCLPAACLPGAVIQTAFAAVVHGRRICLGDVCIYEHGGVRGIGSVWFHVAVNGVLHTCLAPWPQIHHGGHFVKSRVCDDAGLVPTEDLRASCIHTPAAVGAISTILVPMELRE